MTVPTPRHDELDMLTCGLPDDAEITLSVAQVRAVVDEARGIEDDALDAWMDLTGKGL